MYFMAQMAAFLVEINKVFKFPCLMYKGFSFCGNSHTEQKSATSLSGFSVTALENAFTHSRAHGLTGESLAVSVFIRSRGAGFDCFLIER